MWTFIFLYTLGLNICQATGEGNSTQMYYVKLTIERSAIDNITEILRPFVSNNNLRVDNLKITTICGADKVCTCKTGYRWSDELCQSDQKCCDDKCTFTQNMNHMCIFNTTVNITGSLTLTDQRYRKCLSVPLDNDCDELLKEMKIEYSTLSGFDNLRITKYSIGSVIADFIMTFAANINPQDLITKSTSLTKTLNASLVLKTTGVVQLSKPTSPVRYNSNRTLGCSTEEDLGAKPMWQLKKKGTTFNITNGTESDVISTMTETRVFLKNISERWAGEYTCIYQQNLNSTTIFHKASVVLDVSLLPNIDITTAPSFPRCKESSDLLAVKVNCEIQRSTENYDVTWQSESQILVKSISSPSEETVIYVAETVVGCDSDLPAVTCTFQNRLNQSRNATISINTIDEDDPYCAAEDVWEDTKVGFTAVLKCQKKAGQRRRKCKKDNSPTGGKWDDEYSACVNLDVNGVLESANAANVGLGSLDQNAADVFNRLQNVTNDTTSINTFANVNASVQVLVSLSQKLKSINNQSAVDDILKSSSNLLEKTLENSWQTDPEKNNLSLAERYLSSVEYLIEVTNLPNATTKTNIDVAKSDCTQGSQCTNKVFNVTVSLDGLTSDSVKTAGFQQLETYLPNEYDQYKPNSIVVSATTANKQKDGVEVKIDFVLHEERARNVKILCVSWDNDTRRWVEDGCEWKGPSKQGRCVCKHLSSFAMLMSNKPLEIPYITAITNVGLSISVLSLIISLVIELIVWSAVVKTNSLYLRHTAHINISLCLLVADCCFLASTKAGIPIWCVTSVVLKHFCYLSMFFWMLCLSTTLLHQAVFLFHGVSKKNYLKFSLLLGYVCPFLIVVITFITNNAGAEGVYYSKKTCWLVYSGFMKGSIHTFVIPVGIIVFVNVFSMLVVIMKLLNKNTDKSHEKDKTAAKTIVRTIILLTPIFGVTWILGFAVMIIDLTSGVIAYATNYAFTLLNAFQGLFILLTTCLGDKLTRDALLNRLRKKAPASTTDSSTKLDSLKK